MKITLDTETTGLEPAEGARPFLISVIYEDGSALSVDFKVDPVSRVVFYNERLELIRDLMEDPEVTVIFHNAVFDIGMLAAVGIGCRGPIHDTMLMAHVVGGGTLPLGLKPLSEKLFDFPADDLQALKKSVRMAQKALPEELRYPTEADYHLGDRKLAIEYCENDCRRTMLVYDALNGEVEAHPEYADPYEIELKLIPALLSMQQKGVRIFPDTITKLRYFYQGEIKELESHLPEGLNIGSSKQLAAVLQQAGCRLPRTKKGNPSVAESVLKKLDHPIAKTVLDLRHARQMEGTFLAGLEALAVDGTVHPHMNSIGARTGRFSCSRPNLQNMPKKGGIRDCIGPREGCQWILSDYSQLQVWIFAYLSGEKDLQKALLGGQDIHGYIAEQVWGSEPQFTDEYMALFSAMPGSTHKELWSAAPKGSYLREMRNHAKSTVFARLFGGGVNRLAELWGVTVGEAKPIYFRFLERFPAMQDWIDTVGWEAARFGKVESIFGRVYAVDNGKEYAGVNYLVQGTEADIVKRAMIRLHRGLPEGADMVLMVHDEIVVEAPKKMERLEEIIMTSMQVDSRKLGLPAGQKLPVNVARTVTTWADAQ